MLFFCVEGPANRLGVGGNEIIPFPDLQAACFQEEPLSFSWAVKDGCYTTQYESLLAKYRRMHSQHKAGLVQSLKMFPKFLKDLMQTTRNEQTWVGPFQSIW